MPEINLTKVKTVDYCDTQLRIVEGPTYTLNLARYVDSEKSTAQEIGLYEVTLDDPYQIVYVLAESHKGAASQATCHSSKYSTYEATKAREDSAIVRRLPLKIRGWGDTEF